MVHFLPLLLPRILAWGENPIITRFVSTNAIKNFLFIFSKLLIQAYALSMSIKSFMYFFAFYDKNDSDLFKSAFEIYYRGLNHYTFIPFTHATLYFPLIVLAVFYLPSVIYVLILNSRKDMAISEHVLFLVFSVVTNFYYKKTDKENSVSVKKQIIYEKRRKTTKKCAVMRRPESAPPGLARDGKEGRAVVRGRPSSTPAIFLHQAGINITSRNL